MDTGGAFAANTTSAALGGDGKAAAPAVSGPAVYQTISVRQVLIVTTRARIDRQTKQAVVYVLN